MATEDLKHHTPDIVYDAIFRPEVGFENQAFDSSYTDHPIKELDSQASTVSDAQDKTGIANSKPQTKFIPPDGGYGWMIVLGCFLSHVISGGFDRSDGVYFLHFRCRYDMNAQLTAWPGAVVSTLRFVLGPVASAVCNRYSVRTSVLIGALIFSIGVLLNGFATNFYFLFFSYGLLQGIGRGLFSGPALVIVNMYFDKHRGIAAGLGTSGVGVGTFVIVPLTQYLFDVYGFQGAFIILSAIALHMVLVGMLYRPLSLQHMFTKEKAEGNQNHKLTIAVIEDNTNQSGASSLEPEYHVNGITTELTSYKTEHCLGEYPLLIIPNTPCTEKHVKRTVRKRSPIRNKNKRKSSTSSTLSILFPNDGMAKTAEKKLFHFHLLRNPPFLLFCISIMLFTIAFKAAFTFMPALAKSRGVSETDAALILSISGAIDTFGRIAAGVILGLPKLKPFRPLLFNGLVFAIAGISFVVPFLHDFYSFCLVCGLYGMCTGAYVSQKSVVLGDMLGTESIASSFGLLICFQGFGTLIGSPLSGALRDLFGDYDGAFYLGGASMAVAGTVMVLSNVILRRSKSKDSDI